MKSIMYQVIKLQENTKNMSNNNNGYSDDRSDAVS